MASMSMGRRRSGKARSCLCLPTTPTTSNFDLRTICVTVGLMFQGTHSTQNYYSNRPVQYRVVAPHSIESTYSLYPTLLYSKKTTRR